ncbi:unnamed protein product [Periconia digitata]|uniref:Zinc-binding loop region of homing endonuclease domain-containing protein n=1 Tax=Periconia digitata TaxID=1303443 RepID=A0A9W4UIG4_9PLEO|nr:unnamed protein product [Periconia digitata]
MGRNGKLANPSSTRSEASSPFLSASEPIASQFDESPALSRASSPTTVRSSSPIGTSVAAMFENMPAASETSTSGGMRSPSLTPAADPELDPIQADEANKPMINSQSDDENPFSCSIVIDEFSDDEDDEKAIARISSQIPLWEDWSRSDGIKAESEESRNPTSTAPIRDSFYPGENKGRDDPDDQSPEIPQLNTNGLSNWVSSPLLPIRPAPTKAQGNSDATIKKKNLFYHHYAAIQRPALQNRFATFMAQRVQMPSSNQPHSCHLFAGQASGNSSSIKFSISFKHHSQRYRLTLNFGVINLLLHNRLTPEDIHGLVYEKWHLSHLCGNWRCVNIEHIRVEPGAVNENRNKCLRPRKGDPVECEHTPKCLTEHTLPITEEDKRARAGGRKMVVEEEEWRRGLEEGGGTDLEKLNC